MPLYINVVCEKKCVAQNSAFESRSETYGDLLESLEAFGWKVEGEIPDLTFTCPKCQAGDVVEVEVS